MKDLAANLNFSRRTAHRYLELLQNARFLSEVNDSHVYKLIQSHREKHITLSFTGQEVEYILDQLPEENPFNKSIQDKLYIHSDNLRLP